MTSTPVASATIESTINRMRAMCVPALRKFFLPEQRVFAFRVRKTPAGGEQIEGISRRYTAMSLIGLSTESPADMVRVLAPHSTHDVVEYLLAQVCASANLGDVGISIWAAHAVGYSNLAAAHARLAEMLNSRTPQMTVEVAWAVAALSLTADTAALMQLRDATAQRLIEAYNPASSLFPHTMPGGPKTIRSHVACFADLVYPIQALSMYHQAVGNRQALEAATGCGEAICHRMGDAGQWWWHYDYRTGKVVEGYPVYSVHQDAMGPMALFALRDAGGPDLSEYVNRGVAWLVHAPELGGGSLIDDATGWIWRKVARSEPRKLVRRVQAVASSVSPALRVPGTNLVFPPKSVDWESRPYHYGWLLHAFQPRRVATRPRPQPVGAAR